MTPPPNECIKRQSRPPQQVEPDQAPPNAEHSAESCAQAEQSSVSQKVSIAGAATLAATLLSACQDSSGSGNNDASDSSDSTKSGNSDVSSSASDDASDSGSNSHDNSDASSSDASNSGSSDESNTGSTDAESSSDSSDSSDEDIDSTPGFLHVNGKKVEVGTESGRHLLGVLRHNLKLTGAKYGCGEAQCGACKVLIDGVDKPACVVMVENCWGKRIVTIEGIANGNDLSPVQEAFIEEQAFQCGYCTPGMVIAATALLHDNADPSAEQVASALERHLCRCGTYPRIVRATQRAGALLRIRGLA